MTAQSKSVIKSYFETGDKPTQAQFGDLVDSYQDIGGTNNYVTGVSASITNGLVLFTNTSGKAIKGVTNSGVVIVTSGAVTTPAGTSGQVLTSNGAGLAPTFQAAGAGALTLLSTQTISSPVATVDFTSGINLTYSHYIFEISNIVFATNNSNFALLFQQGGSFISSSNYETAAYWVAEGAGGGQVNLAAQASIQPLNGAGANTTGIFNGIFHLFQPSLTTRPSIFWQLAGGPSVSAAHKLISETGAGLLDIAAATTGVRFGNTGTNFSSGTFKLYGIS